MEILQHILNYLIPPDIFPALLNIVLLIIGALLAWLWVCKMRIIKKIIIIALLLLLFFVLTTQSQKQIYERAVNVSRSYIGVLDHKSPPLKAGKTVVPDTVKIKVYGTLPVHNVTFKMIGKFLTDLPSESELEYLLDNYHPVLTKTSLAPEEYQIHFNKEITIKPDILTGNYMYVFIGMFKYQDDLGSNKVTLVCRKTKVITEELLKDDSSLPMTLCPYFNRM